MPILSHFRYRPEVDGLRAVAVLAVVLFHARFRCPGGFVGVDVFFVISGFLITSLIWQDLENGKFTFATFWERRARRIAPALVVVTLVTLVAGYFILSPPDFGDLGKAAASQAVFAANVYYWQELDYFAGPADEKPLLHTWSLAVEEQFYLLVPVIFWAMYRTKALRERRTVIGLLGLCCGLSFALSVYLVRAAPSAAFYLLPTRAWELLLGSIVAFLPIRSDGGRRYFYDFLAVIGLLLILVPLVTYTAETPFPGIAALPPCVGTALVIWVNSRTSGSAPTLVGSALSVSPLVFVGLISYSLYLWHWPLLTYSRYVSLLSLPKSHRAALIVAAFVISLLSWKFVEAPFRTRRLGATRKSMFGYAGVGLAAVGLCGLIAMKTYLVPRQSADPAFASDLETSDVRAGRLAAIGAADPARPPTVLVWGDSHARSALPGMDLVLKEQGVTGLAATHAATPPVLDWHSDLKWGMKDKALEFNEAVFEYVRNHHIPHVVLISAWGAYTKLPENGHNRASFDASLLETVKRLVSIGVQPWVVLGVPAHQFDVQKVLMRPAMYSTEYVQSLQAKPSTNDSEFTSRDLIERIHEAGGKVLDPKPRFVDPVSNRYRFEADGVALYYDAHHLTKKGAEIMLAPLFREALTLNDATDQPKKPAEAN
jgi:peptidoglycan/LPS O-acetylase OafA/YrhL